MSSTTKYTAAPQRDSIDETASYSQAPPSYVEPSSSSDQAALLGGGPRSSEDNIPDDFKFGGTVAEATIDIRMAFVRKVYSILTVQLIATAALTTFSFMNASFKSYIQANTWLVWVSIFASFAMIFLTYWKRKSYPTNLIFLSIFTLLEAYCVAVITSLYESRIVLQAVVITAAVFIVLTIFACQTTYDFTSWASFLSAAVTILLMFSLVFLVFPPGRTLDLVYSCAGALIFSVYILVDTQMLMRHAHVEEEIMMAISLYLDIINLFLFILRILNNTQNN